MGKSGEAIKILIFQAEWIEIYQTRIHYYTQCADSDWTYITTLIPTILLYKNHATTNTLTEVIDHIYKSLNEGNYVSGIVIDL